LHQVTEKPRPRHSAETKKEGSLGFMNETTVEGNQLTDIHKTVAQDAESFVKETATGLSEKAREARARLAASLASAKANMHKFNEKAVEGAKATDRVIRDHPYPSIGVAFGIGILIGVLVTRK
jgi:ElaB/YqjD/DUF883 family membrane-anchored ribosome-binding protein